MDKEDGVHDKQTCKWYSDIRNYRGTITDGGGCFRYSDLANVTKPYERLLNFKNI